ncbi:DUF1415 domain-containing protein [Algimonas arctica]|uniref:DUF1415 domain-containing protein n=1 Tax=Algimonas arctica TaxID=1479486 RepID=UPI001674DFC5|nr:DUF1415 domain-containing protein [Algimonas arctica]
MPNTDIVIKQTRAWLSTVVIGQNFCPFAKREYDRESIHYAIIETADLATQLEQIIAQCTVLDTDPERETSLLIFPTALSNFDDYLDLLDIATALLEDQGYDGIYQLASFHPDYVFDGLSPDDPSHYTNRSPYPMLHILREASVETALATYPYPDKIPVRNIRRTQDLGLKAMQDLLAACYE